MAANYWQYDNSIQLINLILFQIIAYYFSINPNNMLGFLFNKAG